MEDLLADYAPPRHCLSLDYQANGENGESGIVFSYSLTKDCVSIWPILQREMMIFRKSPLQNGRRYIEQDLSLKVPHCNPDQLGHVIFIPCLT
jgi:hypothetical protein